MKRNTIMKNKFLLYTVVSAIMFSTFHTMSSVGYRFTNESDRGLHFSVNYLTDWCRDDINKTLEKGAGMLLNAGECTISDISVFFKDNGQLYSYSSSKHYQAIKGDALFIIKVNNKTKEISVTCKIIRTGEEIAWPKN